MVGRPAGRCRGLSQREAKMNVKVFLPNLRSDSPSLLQVEQIMRPVHTHRVDITHGMNARITAGQLEIATAKAFGRALEAWWALRVGRCHSAAPTTTSPEVWGPRARIGAETEPRLVWLQAFLVPCVASSLTFALYHGCQG